MYRKALVIPATFKVILGVLALVVLAVLLLKVPGLSEKVFWFLEEKYGKVGATEGKALHVWTDPFKRGENKIKVFEFHLTNDEKHLCEPSFQKGKRFYFFLRSFPDDLCTIYTTDDGGFFHKNSGYIYYVNPGSLIQSGKNSIADGISINNSGCVCVVISNTGLECTGYNCKKLNGEETDYPCAGEYNLVKCENPHATFYCEGKREEDEYVIDKPFMTSNVDWKCKESGCELLVKGAYKVKYGLICDADGKWKACTEEKADAGVLAGTTEQLFKCQESEEPSIFVWEPYTEEEG